MLALFVRLGGTTLVTLRAVSDVGIIGLLGSSSVSRSDRATTRDAQKSGRTSAASVLALVKASAWLPSDAWRIRVRPQLWR